MIYKYKAKTIDDKMVKDKVIAKGKEKAIELIRAQDLEVIELKPDWGAWLKAKSTITIGGVPLREKLVFTRNLSLMIKAGITIDESLVILADQSSSKKMAKVLTKIEEEVQTGKTLSESLELFPKIFDSLFIKIIFAAEQSGSLSESLDQLAVHMKRQYELKSKVLSAMFYPLLVIFSTLVISIAMSIFVLPKITTLFRSFDAELPFTTRVVINFANFMSQQTLLGLTYIFGGLFIMYLLIRAKFLRPFWEYTLFRLPSIGKIVRDFNLALFSRTMATLLTSGIPINQAVEITTETMRNVRYSRALKKIAKDQLAGEMLGSLLAERKDLFPPLVQRMVRVGEQSGNLADSLVFLAEFHEEELDYSTKNISTIVEPILILVVGLMVAVLALAVITPIYQITGSFQVR